MANSITLYIPKYINLFVKIRNVILRTNSAETSIDIRTSVIQMSSR